MVEALYMYGPAKKKVSIKETYGPKLTYGPNMVSMSSAVLVF